jgi:hypothetical protein
VTPPHENPLFDKSSPRPSTITLPYDTTSESPPSSPYNVIYETAPKRPSSPCRLPHRRPLQTALLAPSSPPGQIRITSPRGWVRQAGRISTIPSLVLGVLIDSSWNILSLRGIQRNRFGRSLPRMTKNALLLQNLIQRKDQGTSFARAKDTV